MELEPASGPASTAGEEAVSEMGASEDEAVSSDDGAGTEAD